ncbi:MAG TPA: hypothetical protein VHC73_06380 [Vitreimonas sp.]|jgi:hypothetical protein|nr:hypothetical protein [Vitreimonas sp.]
MEDPRKPNTPADPIEDADSIDTPHGRETPATAHGRLHGADRAGLGEKGWSETPDDLTGDPDHGNIDAELYDPLESPAQRDMSRAMPGVIRRAHIQPAHR